jgi:Tc toxin complex TcA C-terminal TcB-binding domain
MLLPFEGMGVDTTWGLQLPMAANPVEHCTIADVYFTVEYTALQSADYRQQVIKRLSDQMSADRPWSLRDQFADQWYALHNPRQTTTPLAVTFKTTRTDFPPNVDKLRIQQVLLAFLSWPKGSRSKSRAHNCASRPKATLSLWAELRGVRWMASSAPAGATPGAGRRSSGKRPWGRGTWRCPTRRR